MLSPPPLAQHEQIALEARTRFVQAAGRAMVELGAAIDIRLQELMDEPAPSRIMNSRRDAWSLYQQHRAAWVAGTIEDWQATLKPRAVMPLKTKSEAGFELLGTEVVEDKILASRLTLGLMGNVSAELNDLQFRIKYLERLSELENHDILRPDVLFLWMIKRWATTGMLRQTWGTVNEVASLLLTERLQQTYASCNAFLIERGVMPTIALEDRVKRLPSAEPRYEQSRSAQLAGSSQSSGAQLRGGAVGARISAGASANVQRPVERRDSGYSSASEETRMLTRPSPMEQQRSQSLGVVGQLKRLLTGSSGTNTVGTAAYRPSPALAAAMAQSTMSPGHSAYGDTLMQDYSPVGVARVADDLRRRTKDLKGKAQTQGEKAVIEVVALMFHAILQEDRIPSAIRLWVARLQMPVLRVALAEPDFFGTLDHPARQLIDRMGSCVMGFDASGINGSALETEIKRVVQVIEQYPETGRRVYQLVYDEFQKFLAQFLTGQASTQRAVSVAQQVEQKETLTIQYTIEMRNMLKDMPVSDAISQFLFKVWAEVLALAAVRKGPQHVDTLALKKLATDLVWSASAKPNRSDRARVIAGLPQLLQSLRAGMTLLGVASAAQDAHIKTVNDTLADAFVSKTQAIPAAQIAAMAERLAHLEDFVDDESAGDLPLDAQSIEMMLGIDASNIDVVTDGGSSPSVAMQAWAQELQLGSWFTLDHNGRVVQVQFVWRSERKHLNLFASTDGRSYLIQAARLAAYLQAGLLVPEEQETLTVRATRDALGKLAANPERLLS
jgi:hypothetical protein